MCLLIKVIAYFYPSCTSGEHKNLVWCTHAESKAAAFRENIPQIRNKISQESPALCSFVKNIFFVMIVITVFFGL